MKDYPINDIFEGTGELLLTHGERDLETHDIDSDTSVIYIKYGGYYYRLIDVAGEIRLIERVTRLERSDGNGKN